MSTKHLFAIFFPALLIASLALFIRILQYRPTSITASEQMQTEARQNSFIPLYPDDPILGDKKASRTIIAFEDFGCDACRVQMQLLSTLVENDANKVKIIWKGLPVTRFPFNTRSAHQFAFCMHRQKQFDAFKNFAFENSTALSDTILLQSLETIPVEKDEFQTCLQSGAAETFIKKIETLAESLNIQSVPAIFIENKQITAPQTIEGWKTLLSL